MLSHAKDNILIADTGDAQITDFGISVIPEFQGFTTVVPRNIRFAAPELSPITELPAGTSVINPTAASDIFSLGILFLQVCLPLEYANCSADAFSQLFHGAVTSIPYNHVPPSNRDPSEIHLLQLIHRGVRPLRENYNFIPNSRWALIEWCWASRPHSRPNITDVREAMRSRGF